MSKTFLLIDCNFLCHRAKHAIGPLEFKGKRTEVAYGFVTDIIYYMETFRTKDIIFCWDYGKNKRKEIYPRYKANRHKFETPEEEDNYKDFQRQVKDLREKYLPQIGFVNNFSQWGYESDDLIAAFVDGMKDEDEAFIISSDKDLYQCIRHNVAHAAPGKPRLTLQGFFKAYAIAPETWAKVKALAGCTGDNVDGIKGVGEKTALKYLLKNLAPHTKAFAAIVSEEGRRIRKRNYKLVRLPYPGAVCERIGQDEIPLKWHVVIKGLGMKSFRKMRIPNG